MQTSKLSWRDIDQLVKKLCAQIKASGFKPGYVVGIAMGGLIPLALVAEKLEVKSIATVSARSYDEKTKKREKLVISHIPRIQARGKSILLIDEIADTGETLKVVSKILKARCGAGEIKTAVLVTNELRCHFPPDFSVMKVDRWVVFPWDA